MAAGDQACDPTASSFNNGLGTSTSCRQKYTSDLLVNRDLAAVLALGDIQYECGGYNAFLRSYDPTWGRVKSVTYPVPGNHEYHAKVAWTATRPATRWVTSTTSAPRPATRTRVTTASTSAPGT